MKVTTRELGNRQVELIIEVDNERIDPAMRTVAREYARQIKIPGFRPGRAPFAVVAQRVGQDRLLEDALGRIGPQIYEEAITEAGIEPYDLKPLEVTNYDPLTLSATIPLVPKVELGDYSSIQIEAPTVEITEEEIEEVLREYQAENAQLVPVERAAELGDQVIIDLKIVANYRPVYDRQNISFVLSPDGLTGVPDGFFKQIAGMEAGQEKEISLTYPDDFGDEELAGQVGTFTVVLHEVKARELPELDDELAWTVGDFETLEELRERTREVLLARAENETDSELSEKIIVQLKDMATVEYPPQALEDEIDRLIANLETRLEDRGLTLENHLLMEGLTQDQLRAEQRSEAEERVKRGAILSEVVEREGIEVTTEEIDEEIEVIAGMYGARATQARASLSSAESRRSLGSRLLAEKAIDRLIEIATNTDEVDEVDAVDESEDIEPSEVVEVESDS